MELGDAVESALSKAGITKERVSKWLGRPCKCPERQRKLNLLSIWAKRKLLGKSNYDINEVLTDSDETN